MSPVTHSLASWVLASFPRLERRDVALVTIAGVAPDIDGLGIIPELATRHSGHPLDWFSRYHHVLAHNLIFAIAVALIALALARRRWLTAALAFLAVHLHFFMDVLGSRGPEGYNWPIPYFEPFSSRVQIAWSGQWALNAWQNIVITLALLVWTMIRAVQIGRSPVEIFSPSADRKVVAALRQRWSRIAAEESEYPLSAASHRRLWSEDLVTVFDSLVAACRGFMRVLRWFMRLAMSAVGGLMALMLVCVSADRFAGSHNWVRAVFCTMALPCGIVVGVISYKFLRPSE